MAQNKYISTKDAVQLTGLKTQGIYDLIHEGKLPARKAPKSGWRILQKDLELLGLIKKEPNTTFKKSEIEDCVSYIADEEHYTQEMAYLGSVSGRDEDKVAKAGLTPVYADNTVYFQEAKLVLVCKKMYASELQESGFIYQDTIDANYPQRDFHTMYVGKIEKVLVRDDEYNNE